MGYIPLKLLMTGAAEKAKYDSAIWQRLIPATN
nr:MAG TPA_asm: hypothetical protein [Caudoviricetes sp.]